MSLWRVNMNTLNAREMLLQEIKLLAEAQIGKLREIKIYPIDFAVRTETFR